MSKNVVAAAFVLSLTCLPAKADIIDVTATGTINLFDYTGVFGQPATLGVLLPFSASYVFDTTRGAGDQTSNIFGGTSTGFTSPVIFALSHHYRSHGTI